MKLEERDERILALLGTRSRPVAALVAGLDLPPADVEARLAALVDNGLVSDLGDGRYARTESGRRVLVTLPKGTADERIDTTPEVERAIDELGLRADEADAVRHVFALLRYWGRVTEEEIVDAIYSETPAGRETASEWWNGLVREALVALPSVDPPDGDDAAWRYTGTPETADSSADGRGALSRTHPVYGDVKHALESLELTDAEREAARAAFRYIYRRGDVTERDLRETVYPAFAAGYTSSQAWWDDVVSDALEVLPGIERTDERRWRYRRPG